MQNAIGSFNPHLKKGRGAQINPVNRFEPLDLEPDPEFEDVSSQINTRYLKDSTKTILTTNTSPDIPFRTSINPYRGCEHGCIYCYARPTHEYFGLSSGIDFESVIFVKSNVSVLLKKEMLKKSWVPQVVAMSGVTDPYQPVEKKLKITRSCLEVFNEFHNPVAIITKNHLVTRDIDLLKQLNETKCVSVAVSITTTKKELCDVMEPRTSRPIQRFKAIEQLRQAGIPVGVMIAPIIPGLTEEEIPAILKSAADAGAKWAGYVVLKLPYAVKDVFQNWLDLHFPDRKNKILNRIREMHGGTLYKAEFGKRMTGEGIYAQQIQDIFRAARKKIQFQDKWTRLSTESFKRPSKQLELFNI